MTLLKYTVPAHSPGYPSQESPIHPGTFLLQFPPLIAALQKLASGYSQAPQSSGRRKEYLEVLPLITWLEHEAASGAWIIDWDGSQPDLVSHCAGDLIYSRQFASVSCPACEMEYSPLEGSIREWKVSRDNVHQSGRRFICPCGHTLYALMEQSCIEFSTVFTIEQEHAPSFRAALMAVGDSLVAGAAAEGEITFLKTKVFDQSYIDFCDGYAAESGHPAASSEMKRRREAILPFVGQPLLHGLLRHEGSLLNVFMDNASNRVIHWESESISQL